MQSNITTQEVKSGLFFKERNWRVTCQMNFTREELAIVDNHGFGKSQIYLARLISGEKIPVTLSQVVKNGIWSIFPTLADALKFEHELTTRLLPLVKSYVAASKQTVD